MSRYSAPQVVRIGDVRAATQGMENYLSDSAQGWGYMGWYPRRHDTPDTVTALPPRA